MKSLSRYIFEKYDTYKVQNLKISYKFIAKDKTLEFQAPEKYSEDDFQIYVQDKYFSILPGGDRAEEFFGKNVKYLNNYYFEYEGFERNEENKTDGFIAFDKDYDDKVKEDDKMSYITLKDPRYSIEFDEFELNSENIDMIHDDLIQIFKRAEIEDKKLDFSILLDEDSISYN